jgi:hypothetical protein
MTWPHVSRHVEEVIRPVAAQSNAQSKRRFDPSVEQILEASEQARMGHQIASLPESKPMMVFTVGQFIVKHAGNMREQFFPHLLFSSKRGVYRPDDALNDDYQFQQSRVAHTGALEFQS